MKFKDMLFPIALALLTTWLIQYWFLGSKKKEVEQTPTSFVAPQSKQETRPLNREVDFIDEKRLHAEVLTEVETGLAKYLFSNDGASLDRLEYKGASNGKLAGLGTVFPVSSTERENRCFLLAFNEKTPYFYKFMGKTDKGDFIEVAYRYESPNSDYVVDKKFLVHKNTYRVDLEVATRRKSLVSADKEAKDQTSEFGTRLSFPSPLMPELGTSDTISSIVFDKANAFKKTAIGSLNDSFGNYGPKIFGSDSKYFVHAMVDDYDGYANRAYYKRLDQDKLFTILEGPIGKDQQLYKLSFYLGPKEEKALEVVDPRLEKTLDYSGWFSIISKALLKILQFLYKHVGNYGWAIIILTLLIRLLMLPFSIKAESGMKKRIEFQKKLDYLKKKYKHDKEALAREQAELLKKHGMPGLGGCLPLLLQIPIFIALSNLLRSSIELYRAPFGLWITDLSAKDPYYVLPILMSVSMLAQAFTVDPKQRFMMIAMALIVGPMFATFPAGLALYIVASVGIGVLQTFIIKKFKSA